MKEHLGFPSRRQVEPRIPPTRAQAAMIVAGLSLLLSFGIQERGSAMAAGRNQPSATCGWIGVGVKPMSRVFAESLGMDATYGAIFKQPLAGSPAARAGIEAGDVLTSINGNPLQNWTDFAGSIAAFAPGDTIHLWLRRNGQLIDVKLTLDGGKCPRAANR
jgi:serine protease Do